MELEKYWVEGGEYVNTEFLTLKGDLETWGPYDSYTDALVKWREVSWKHVDDCHRRYTIVRHAPEFLNDYQYLTPVG